MIRKIRFRTLLIGTAIIALVLAGTWYLFRSTLDDNVSDPALAKMGKKPTLPPLALPPTENKAFAVGETLRYKVIYKGVTVGHAVLKVSDGPIVNDRPTLKYVATAKSTKFFDAFFKVRDRSASIVDRASLYSLAFDQDLNEGHYDAVRKYTFDYLQRQFTAYEKKKKSKEDAKEGVLNAATHDVLSAIYFIRTRDLQPGRAEQLMIFRESNDKQIPVTVDKEPKDLKTSLGKVSCLRIEPMIQGDTLFRSKDDKLVIWLTNDQKKIPVLIEATIKVGLIRVKLETAKK